MLTIEKLKKSLEEMNAEHSRSAWARGVGSYALDLLDDLDEWSEYEKRDEIPTSADLEKILLNGADSWSAFSWGGSALIYNEDIARRLCTPSELKKTRDGDRKPSASEEWLDTQARALWQACNRIKQAAATAKRAEA